MKILLDHHALDVSQVFQPGSRPAVPIWVTPLTAAAPPELTAYRVRCELPQAATMRVHVSADERYRFFVDGREVGRGPERGSDQIWYYESYDLSLDAGEHVFVAFVWRLGSIGPLAQVSLEGGWLLRADAPYDALVSTGSAAWECRPVPGLSFARPEPHAADGAWFVQPNQTTDAARYPWGIEQGGGDGWEPTRSRDEYGGYAYGLQPIHRLQPATLPAQRAAPWPGGRVRHVAVGSWLDEQIVQVDGAAHQLTEASDWQALMDGDAPLVVPPRTRRQVIVDLDNYVCGYPSVVVSGGQGSRVTLGWAEALHLDPHGKAKGQRDEVDGRAFLAVSRDTLLPDGGSRRVFEPLWWRAGRYIAWLVETAENPLVIEAFHLSETRYPLEMESRFSASDPRLERVIPLAVRGLQMCAHETYMDCPYYEQMMYVGDTRLEALTTYAISADDRLPRKALALFDRSRLSGGLTQARYPGRDVQVIPPFSLWWIGMLYDYALWRGDRAFVASLLPAARSVLDAFLAQVSPEGLLQALPGWNFADWVPEWPIGVPPEGFSGVSGVINWHLIYTLGLAIRLEEMAGDPWMAKRWEDVRDRLADSARTAFWDEARGLLADDLAHAHFSEHTQCLALLSGALRDGERQRVGENLLRDLGLTRTTIYFTHYLFETYRVLGQTDALLDRLGLWFDLPGLGFKTPPEMPEQTRSDCHAWGAHPLYHYFATLTGIRPTSFGFADVEVAPQPGPLSNLSASLVHSRGAIDVSLDFDGDRVRGRVTLPEGVNGVFRWRDQSIRLAPGEQSIAL